MDTGMKAIADRIRGIHRDLPPDDLAPKIVAALNGVPPPSASLWRRLLWRLDGPFAAWGYRLAVLGVLAGIMAGIWTLVGQRNTSSLQGGGEGVAQKVHSTSQGPDEHRVSVTFVYYAPKAESVALVGTFNDWNPRKTPMVKGRNGTWNVRLNLTSGRYEYLFLVNGRRYETDPNAVEVRPDGLGHENAVLRL
jgi:hypothetical protein